MKNFFILLVFAAAIPAFAAGIGKNSSSSIYSVSPTANTGGTSIYATSPTVKTLPSNSILNVQSGIKANQSSIQNQFSTNGSTGIKTPPPPPPSNGTVIPTYIPTVYGWSRYENTTPKEQVNINNTYNYYGANSSSETQTNVQNTSQNSTAVKTQEQLNEEERQVLKKKYSSILSNKTASNEKICSQMEQKFKSADYEELERVLNTVLKLNCDIEKLRPLN